MCVERSIATKSYEKYEKKKWHLGVFLVIVQVGITVADKDFAYL